MIFLVACAIVPASLPFGYSEEVDNWPTFQHDNYHTGSSNTEISQDIGVLWTKDVENGISPTLVSDRIFLQTKGNIISLDANSGEDIWTLPYLGHSSIVPQPFPPTVDNESVYVTSFIPWEVSRLDIETGELLWSFPTRARIYSAPVLYQGKIFVGSMDGSFYSLDSRSGSLLWNFTTWGARPILTTPIVVDGQVCFASNDGFLYNLNSTTGELVWKYQINTIGNYQYSSPSYSNGKVFIGSRFPLNEIKSINFLTGELIWSLPTGSITGTAALFDGRVYIVTSSNSIFSLDENTGDIVWEQHDWGIYNDEGASPLL